MYIFLQTLFMYSMALFEVFHFEGIISFWQIWMPPVQKIGKICPPPIPPANGKIGVPPPFIKKPLYLTPVLFSE